MSPLPTIIRIGLPRTGGQSTAAALRLCGYTHVRHDMYTPEQLDQGEAFMETHFDPTRLLNDLQHLKAIWTPRDKHAWLASIERVRKFRGTNWHPVWWLTAEHALAEYENRQSLAEALGERCLTLRVCDGWADIGELAGFVGRDVAGNFPNKDRFAARRGEHVKNTETNVAK